MKFSIEAIVAAVVALVFAVLILGAIAREQGTSTNMPALKEVAALGFDSSSSRPLLGGTGEGQLLAQY